EGRAHDRNDVAALEPIEVGVRGRRGAIEPHERLPARRRAAREDLEPTLVGERIADDPVRAHAGGRGLHAKGEVAEVHARGGRGEAAVGWRGEAAVGWRGEAAVGWRGEAVVGWRGEAVVGWMEGAVAGAAHLGGVVTPIPLAPERRTGARPKTR